MAMGPRCVPLGDGVIATLAANAVALIEEEARAVHDYALWLRGEFTLDELYARWPDDDPPDRQLFSLAPDPTRVLPPRWPVMLYGDSGERRPMRAVPFDYLGESSGRLAWAR